MWQTGIIIEMVLLIILLAIGKGGISLYNSLMSWGILIGLIPITIGLALFVGAESIIGKIFIALLIPLFLL